MTVHRRLPRLLARAAARVAPVLIAALAAMLMLTSVPVAAQSSTSPEDEIRTMLEQRDAQIKSILKGADDYTDEQRQELQTLINGVIDFRAMAETALGPHWAGLSQEKKDEFVSVFRDIVRAQSLSDLEVYNSRVTFDEVIVDGDSAYVRTTTEYKDTSTPVEYDLERQDDGTWLAEDIILDDVSTAQGYARSFQSIVRKHGFDALLTSLKKRRDRAS